MTLRQMRLCHIAEWITLLQNLPLPKPFNLSIFQEIKVKYFFWVTTGAVVLGGDVILVMEAMYGLLTISMFVCLKCLSRL